MATPLGARIIPALAGNTAPPPNRLTWRTDHPRSRGEYEAIVLVRGLPPGSSPLSRGIPDLVDSLSQFLRIIPALAGNTRRPWPWSRSRGDHPRSRGEYGAVLVVTHSKLGSSPLSRGIPKHRTHRHRRHRIIPALAGNTPSWRSRTGGISDHPRSRGEYFASMLTVFHHHGSSPLSRGIPHPRRGRFRTARIIPALAGNTRVGWGGYLLHGDHPRSRGEYPALPAPG